MDALEFLDQFGRLPMLGDSVAPWHYRGWLLPYIAGVHETTLFRWPYLMRTLAAGEFLQEPIPKLLFGEPRKSVYKSIQDWCCIIGYDAGGWSDFCTLLDWLLYGLRLSNERPKNISEDKNRKLYQNVDVTEMIQHPYDYLGTIVSEHKANGWNPTAFYPTPHAVCESMVQMVFHDMDPDKTGKMSDGRDVRAASVCEPCLGSGRMLMHASNYSMNLYGQDCDRIAINMALINGALYAPWMSFPLPKLIVGDGNPISIGGILI